MSRLLEFIGWIAACVLSGLFLNAVGDFDGNSMVDITIWLLLAGLFMISTTVILTVIVTIASATTAARAYYRENRDAQWPDRLLVRLCMWRCR
jgi:hypothetical protein